MIYSNFQDKKLSLLGFGAMRLPTCPDGTVDEAQTREIVRMCIANGINYFDTAWPYHGGESERVLSRILSEFDRSSYYLADKYPGHQIISSGYDPSDIFEKQLEKCRVDYFDFYLLHNVYEKSIETYSDPKWNIIEYFKEQKRLGRIKHLGFSSHGGVDFLRDFLDKYGDDMEFCQIQLNYLDWTLQKAKKKYDLLTERGIPVWVMEPVRGGKLAKLSDKDESRLNAVRPGESDASWCFRFLQTLPNVKMILSGMSNAEQAADNIKTFSECSALDSSEVSLLMDIAEGMKDSIPCTGCRYCCDGCPMGLDIPMLLSVYNDIRYLPSTNVAMRIEFLPDDKKPSACIGCGSCTQICPQNINIPQSLSDFAEALKAIPSWTEICRQREEAQKK